MELTQVAGEVGFRAAGDLAEKMGWEEGSKEKVILHSIVGAGVAALGGGNALEGAASAATTQIALGKMLAGLKENGIDPTSAEGSALLQLASLAIGGAVGGGEGATIALSATKNNYLTHQQLEDLERALAGCGDDESCKNRELDAARDLSRSQDAALRSACSADPAGQTCNAGMDEAKQYWASKSSESVRLKIEGNFLGGQQPTVIKWPNGDTIVYMPIELTGNSDERRSAAMADAQTKASQLASPDGNVFVVIEDASKMNIANSIKFDISNGKQEMGNAQGEGVHVEEMRGHLDGSRLDIGSVITHDGLHPFSVPDQYVYQRDAAGNIIFDPVTRDPLIVRDLSNNNIMGWGMGDTFNANQLDTAEYRRSTKIKICTITSNYEVNCQ
jgi:flavin-binding protein dodecin